MAQKFELAWQVIEMVDTNATRSMVVQKSFTDELFDCGMTLLAKQIKAISAGFPLMRNDLLDVLSSAFEGRGKILVKTELEKFGMENQDAIPTVEALDRLKLARSLRVFDGFRVLSILDDKDPVILGYFDTHRRINFHYITSWGHDFDVNEILKNKYK